MRRVKVTWQNVRGRPGGNKNGKKGVKTHEHMSSEEKEGIHGVLSFLG